MPSSQGPQDRLLLIRTNAEQETCNGCKFNRISGRISECIVFRITRLATTIQRVEECKKAEALAKQTINTAFKMGKRATER